MYYTTCLKKVNIYEDGEGKGVLLLFPSHLLPASKIESTELRA